jgi:hypothetical protein
VAAGDVAAEAGVADRRPGLDPGERRLDRVELLALQDAVPARGRGQVVGRDVPAGEDEVAVAGEAAREMGRQSRERQPVRRHGTPPQQLDPGHCGAGHGSAEADERDTQTMLSGRPDKLHQQYSQRAPP